MVAEAKRVKFPGWRFGPEGQAEIFNSEDEVPLGWTDNPNSFGDDAAAADAADPDGDKRTQLDRLYTATQLLGFLEEMAALDDTIEVNTSMRKPELIAAIIANGGPLEEPSTGDTDDAVEPAPEVTVPPVVRSGEKVAVTDGEVKEFADAHTNKSMVERLKKMQAEDDRIEFSPNWPGMKLARTILENGGSPE
jgi:hypothetical protein